MQSQSEDEPLGRTFWFTNSGGMLSDSQSLHTFIERPIGTSTKPRHCERYKNEDSSDPSQSYHLVVKKIHKSKENAYQYNVASTANGRGLDTKYGGIRQRDRPTRDRSNLQRWYLRRGVLYGPYKSQEGDGRKENSKHNLPSRLLLPEVRQ